MCSLCTEQIVFFHLFLFFFGGGGVGDDGNGGALCLCFYDFVFMLCGGGIHFLGGERGGGMTMAAELLRR